MVRQAPNLIRTLRVFQAGKISSDDLCIAFDHELRNGMTPDQLRELLEVYKVSPDVRETLEKHISRAQADPLLTDDVTVPLGGAAPKASPGVVSRQATSPSSSSNNNTSAQPAQSGTSPTASGAARRSLAAHESAAGIGMGAQHVDTIVEGVVLDERYKLVNRLAIGGTSTVYKARDLKNKDPTAHVAIKVLNVGFRNELRSLVDFEHEAKAGKSLSHPGLTRVMGYESGDPPYIVLEYIEGVTLAARLRQISPPVLPVREALKIVNLVGSALKHMHDRGYSHCDVKPENIMLSPSGDVKLIDFGVARLLKVGPKPALSPNFANSTTINYASPEILELHAPDRQTDVYSLAVTAYRLIAGQLPFGDLSATVALADGLTPRRPDGLTNSEWNALRKALALDHDSRTPSIDQFLEELSSQKNGRWRVPAAIAASLFLVVSTSVAYIFLSNSGDTDDAPPVPVTVADEQRTSDTPDAMPSTELRTTARRPGTSPAAATSPQENVVAEKRPIPPPPPADRVANERRPPPERAQTNIDDAPRAPRPAAVDRPRAPDRAVATVATTTQSSFVSPRQASTDADAVDAGAVQPRTSSVAVEPPPVADSQVPVESSTASAPAVAPRSFPIINEFMADNDISAYDPQGDYDDWIELYNPAAQAINLDGLYLTNDAGQPRQWRFPDNVMMPARGYLLIWADEHASYTRVSRRQVELHASFKLHERGGEVLLIDTDANGNRVVDRVAYGRQREDFSYARVAAGKDTFRPVVRGTPGGRN